MTSLNFIKIGIWCILLGTMFTLYGASQFKLTNKSGKTIFYNLSSISSYQSLKNNSSITAKSTPLSLYLAFPDSLKETEYTFDSPNPIEVTIDTKRNLVTGLFKKTIKPAQIGRNLTTYWFNENLCIKLGVYPEATMTPKQLALSFVGLDSRKIYTSDFVTKEYTKLKTNWTTLLKTAKTENERSIFLSVLKLINLAYSVLIN